VKRKNEKEWGTATAQEKPGGDPTAEVLCTPVSLYTRVRGKVKSSLIPNHVSAQEGGGVRAHFNRIYRGVEKTAHHQTRP